MNPLNNLGPVTKNLLIINVVCFLGSMIFEPATRFFGIYYPDSPFFRIWQPITYMFMHGSFFHIFFNMFALVMFGSIVESVLGSKRFLNFYLITGLGALVLQYGVQAMEVYQITGSFAARDYMRFDMLDGRIYANRPMLQEEIDVLASIYGIPMVGASGAVFGVLLAFAYLFPNMVLYLIFPPIPVKAKVLIPILILIEIYLGFSNSGSSIAHLAHVGGALFGFIMLKIWRIQRPHYY